MTHRADRPIFQGSDGKFKSEPPKMFGTKEGRKSAIEFKEREGQVRSVESTHLFSRGEQKGMRRGRVEID